MARRLRTWVTAGVLALCLPAAVAAQSSFTGTVRDTSGAVLPGVSVEAASPALIEGSKSDVTGANGAYRIVDLRPGVYTVTFTLPGFKQVRQEKVELRVDFVGTLNANLEVGAIEEAITVTGTSPTVDVSSNAKVEVMTAEILEQVPDGPVDSSPRTARERRLPERAGRRRLARHAADLHVDARSHLGQQHRDG